jgi:hypothetical protein
MRRLHGLLLWCLKLPSWTQVANNAEAAVSKRSASQLCARCGVHLSPHSLARCGQQVPTACMRHLGIRSQPSPHSTSLYVHACSVDLLHLSKRSQKRCSADLSLLHGKPQRNQVAVVRTCKLCLHRNMQPFVSAHAAQQMVKSEAAQLPRAGTQLEPGVQAQQESATEADAMPQSALAQETATAIPAEAEFVAEVEVQEPGTAPASGTAVAQEEKVQEPGSASAPLEVVAEDEEEIQEPGSASAPLEVVAEEEEEEEVEEIQEPGTSPEAAEARCSEEASASAEQAVQEMEADARSEELLAGSPWPRPDEADKGGCREGEEARLPDVEGAAGGIDDAGLSEDEDEVEEGCSISMAEEQEEGEQPAPSTSSQAGGSAGGHKQKSKARKRLGHPGSDWLFANHHPWELRKRRRRLH